MLVFEQGGAMETEAILVWIRDRIKVCGCGG